MAHLHDIFSFLLYYYIIDNNTWESAIVNSEVNALNNTDTLIGRYVNLRNKNFFNKFVKHYKAKGSAFLLAAMLAFSSSGMDAVTDNQLIGCTARAQAAYDEARDHEPAITSTMLTIASESRMELTGLEHSVKTGSSVVNKVQRKVHASTNSQQATDYVMNMHDLVRYTLVGNSDTLTDSIQTVIRLLQADGYTITEIDNKFLNPANRYKAVHMTVVSPEQQSFEIQIHSTEGRQAGLATHDMYEEFRSPATSEERKAELFTQIKSIYDAVPIPSQIGLIHNIG